jgi:hypothetical protein
MAFSPTSFVSNVNSKGGLARPSRFQVVLPIPAYIAQFVKNSLIERILNLPNAIATDISSAINSALGATGGSSLGANPTISRYLSLQCESAELPGKNLVTEDVKIYGPTFKVPYQTQYAETTLSFICTNDFFERKLFERWMEAIMPTDTNNLRFPKGENTKYMTDITVKQYNDDVTQIFGVKMIDAFPISIAAQPLSWGDDNFHRLSIQFAYQRYETITETSVDVGEAITSVLFGGGGALVRAF